MWAARGSGPGFFGVVTRLYLKLRPLPDVVAVSMQIHPFSAFGELTAWGRRTGFPGSIIAGANPTFGQDDLVLMMVGYAFADTLEHAKEKLAALETAPNLDRAIVHQIAEPVSLEQLYGMYDQMYPEGMRYLSDNVWIDDLDAPGLWDDIRAVFESLPTQNSSGWLMPNFAPTPHPNASFSLTANLCFQLYAGYEDHAQDDVMRAWHNEAVARVEKYSIGGGYVGDSNLYEHPMAVLHPDSAARLEELRAKYDPEGRFDSYPTDLPAARI
jgi:FAD/FMN-containing dehydrogenase